MIGNLGTAITFQVSSNRILTPQNMTRKVSANWVKHTRFYNKPLSEYIGPNLQTMSFEIVLSAALNVSPAKVVDTLEYACENGIVMPLVIGNKRVGLLWKITSISQPYDKVLSSGQLVECKLQVEIEEYC